VPIVLVVVSHHETASNNASYKAAAASEPISWPPMVAPVSMMPVSLKQHHALDQVDCRGIS
jgi:hypothetical protein